MIVDDVAATGSFHVALRAFKRELVRSALGMHLGNKLKAARELGISRCYLHRLLNQLEIADASVPEEFEEMMESPPALPIAGSDGLALRSRAA